MQLPDGTTLMHGAAPYDAVKAHEYYLKNRKLLGRKPGLGLPLPTSKLKTSSMVTLKSNGKTYKLSAQQLTEQKLYAAQRVKGITDKLHLLSAELKKRMAEARKAEQAAKKPPSAADKAAQAKASSQYRSKNKQVLANKSKQTVSKTSSSKKSDPNSVEGLKKTIEGVKKNLTDALNRQRALSTATKG